MNEAEEEFKNINQLRIKFPFGRLGRMRLGGDMRFVYHQEGEMLFTIDQMGMSRDCLKIHFVFYENEKVDNSRYIKLEKIELIHVIDLFEDLDHLKNHPHLYSAYLKFKELELTYRVPLIDLVNWWTKQEGFEYFTFAKRNGTEIVNCDLRLATLYKAHDKDNWHPIPLRYFNEK